jgi:hypothetical protein
VNAFNEATAGIPTWPSFPTLGTIGWRRECITAEQLAASPMAQLVRSLRPHEDGKGKKGGAERRARLRARETALPKTRELIYIGVLSSSSRLQLAGLRLPRYIALSR